MTKKSQQKPAGEMINEFFGELNNLEGMDEQVAKIIQDLWKNGKLRRDELTSELKRIRSGASSDE
jgi:hypothetical protein